MLRKIRLCLAALCFVAITLLFLDFSGTIHAALGWLARIQFIPAVLAVNAGVVVALVALTLLFGRLYCSVICPLGVMQDVVSWGAARRTKNRFRFSPALRWLRYAVLVFFVASLVAGVAAIPALLEPYSAYGRIASNLLAPLWLWGNNALAYLADRVDSYAFYGVEVWLKSVSSLVIAALTLIVVGVLAWRNGRTYCNTICPVGTLLGFLARYSLYKPRIDTALCNSCGLCARNCKASCIDSKSHTIDYSRCVTCFDCLEKCNKGAIRYERCGKKNETKEPAKPIDKSRRSMLTASAVVLSSAAIKAQETKMDGGLAFIEDKKIPRREAEIVPPGAQSVRHFRQHCTGCQLCISVCPNQVLRPSSKLESLLQPEVSFERGYCRPECVRCGEVCPNGAIRPLTTADKSATQVGHAVWIEANCVTLRDNMQCDNCLRHCPTEAIQQVAKDPAQPNGLRIPVVDTERCIGCGACENLCPARPFSAIYVEGHPAHRTI